MEGSISPSSHVETPHDELGGLSRLNDPSIDHVDPVHSLPYGYQYDCLLVYPVVHARKNLPDNKLLFAIEMTWLTPVQSQ